MATGTYVGDVTTLKESGSVKAFPKDTIAGGVVYCSVDRSTALTATGLTLGSTHKVGALKQGSIVLYSIIYPVATATFDAPDATTGATTGVLGIAGDTDLFGDVTTLGSTTPQVVIPKPDGTTFANRLAPLEEDVDVILTSAAVDWTTAEGFVCMIFYTTG